MKTTSLFLLVIIISTDSLRSQEWKWRDKHSWELEHRVLNVTFYDSCLFNNLADFRMSIFDSAAGFNRAILSSVADFDRAKFASTADFMGAKFNSAAIFFSAEFDSTATFQEAEFNSGAVFGDVKFFFKANFMRAKFSSPVHFIGAKFDSTATFQEAEFNSKVSFGNTKYYSLANFMGAKFDSTANFRRARFHSTITFGSAKFSDTVIFRLAEFYGESYFQFDTLPRYLDFSQVTKISYEIDLTKAVINPEYNICYINLTDATIDKFRFRYKRFKLWFPTKDSIEYEIKANVYEELLMKQMTEGFTQSFEILDKEYREFQYTDEGSNYWWISGNILNWIDKNWWGYSYDKERIVWNTILIYLLLSLINTFWLKYLTTRVYINQDINELWSSREKKGKLNRAISSFWYSLFYTAVIFFGLKFDMQRLKYKDNLDGWKRLNLIYFFTIYLGGFVCLAYLANYIITI